MLIEPDLPNLSLKNKFCRPISTLCCDIFSPTVRYNLEANGGGVWPFQYQTKSINLPERLPQGGGYEEPLKKSLPYLKSNDFHLLLTLKKKFNTNIKTSKEAWNASDIKSMQKISLSRFLATFRAPINLF